jgi:hypothetical protein
MDETQIKSPRICFSADSYLIYGIRRDSQVTKIGSESVARVSARSASNEQWEFDDDGLMRREASINDVPIAATDRLFHWPLGPRPADYKGLS